MGRALYYDIFVVGSTHCTIGLASICTTTTHTKNKSWDPQNGHVRRVLKDRAREGNVPNNGGLTVNAYVAYYEFSA